MNTITIILILIIGLIISVTIIVLFAIKESEKLPKSIPFNKMSKRQLKRLKEGRGRYK